MTKRQIGFLARANVNKPRFLKAIADYETLCVKNIGAKATAIGIELEDKAYSTLSKRFWSNPVGVMALIKEIGPCRMFEIFFSQTEAVLVWKLKPVSELLLGFNLSHLLQCKKCLMSIRKSYHFDRVLRAIAEEAGVAT
jgi:hypothetical protein